MRTPALPLLLAAFLVTPASAAGAGATTSAPWAASLQDARTAARQADKLILVDLYADWCGWCKKLDAEVFSTPEFLAWAGREAVLLRVDTEDGSDGTMLDRRFGGGTLPTTLVLTPDFAVVARIGGFLPAASFIARLESEVGSWKRLDQQYPKLLGSNDMIQLEQLADALRGREDGHRAALLYRRAIEVGQPNPIKRADLLTRTADAHRLAAEYDQAMGALDQAGPLLAAAGETVAARAELLRSQVLHERGDCPAAKSGLEGFLAGHPQSELAGSAQRLLQLITSGQSPTCA